MPSDASLSSSSPLKTATSSSPSPTSSMVSTTSAALLSGGVQAIIFNPIDRALYLRVFHKRSLFHRENWTNPLQGFANAALHRILCSGTYLVWQDTFSSVEMDLYFSSNLQERLFVGILAGSCNGLCLNSLQLLKYRMWTDGENSVSACLRALYSQGGSGIFFRGIGISIARDMIFGVTYEGLRGQRRPPPTSSPHALSLEKLGNFAKDWGAASVACVLSSPLNYCRNISYGAPPNSCPVRPFQLVKFMLMDAARGPSLISSWNRVNTKLNVGWGSLRVGAGMALGQFSFETFKLILK